MSQAFVADASVAIGWVHPGQATAISAATLDAIAEGSVFEVPALWPLEVANALVVLTRRGKLTERERRTAVSWLRAFPFRLDHDGAAGALSTLSDIAVAHRLSVYDATYLELAERRRLALACVDGPLRKAAQRAGIRLWAP